MPKKKPEVKEEPVPPVSSTGPTTQLKAMGAIPEAAHEVAPDAETEPGTESEASESVDGTVAIPLRDPRIATGGHPAGSTGNTTRPIPLENLPKAEVHEAAKTPSHPSGIQVPEDSTHAIPKQRPHHEETGPLPPEPARASRPKVAPQSHMAPKAPMPSWIWALVGGIGTLLVAGGGFYLYTRMAGGNPGREADLAVVSPSSEVPDISASTPETPIAIRSYLEIAEHGKTDKERANAMVSIGLMYAEGINNVQQDRKKAREWYTKAAALGHGSASAWLKNNPEPGN